MVSADLLYLRVLAITASCFYVIISMGMTAGDYQ